MKADTELPVWFVILIAAWCALLIAVFFAVITDPPSEPRPIPQPISYESSWKPGDDYMVITTEEQPNVPAMAVMRNGTTNTLFWYRKSDLDQQTQPKE